MLWTSLPAPWNGQFLAAAAGYRLEARRHFTGVGYTQRPLHREAAPQPTVMRSPPLHLRALQAVPEQPAVTRLHTLWTLATELIASTARQDQVQPQRTTGRG